MSASYTVKQIWEVWQLVTRNNCLLNNKDINRQTVLIRVFLYLALSVNELCWNGPTRLHDFIFIHVGGKSKSFNRGGLEAVGCLTCSRRRGAVVSHSDRLAANYNRVVPRTNPKSYWHQLCLSVCGGHKTRCSSYYNILLHSISCQYLRPLTPKMTWSMKEVHVI